MSRSVQYVTNETGEKIGVLLDLETYYQLIDSSEDRELLKGLSSDELEALADSILSPKAQGQLDDLLANNSEGEVSIAENDILDNLLPQIDQLNIIKTRAKYSLEYLESK
ncbi:MAG: hypothetical protein QNJ47_07150 [Nostocaceae cyanobacterium]|nr:hypothetical protein [Nostocaceae cyanobacterium]